MSYYQRRLPHWHPEGRDIFITWRLEGTLPKNRYVAPEGLTTGQAFVWIDRVLDRATYGPSWMRRPEIAEAITKSILRGETELHHYALHAFVIMPNHVHMLITPAISVPKLMQSLKGFTARTANLLLDRTGLPFWQRESYDHWVREGEFERIARYVEWNPVKAGFASEPHLYPWSSAALREAGRSADLPPRVAAPH